MSALHEALRSADEAYLVGMSNRGIYKRAVKDLEGAQITVTYTDDAAQVSVSGEVCTVRDPLWESTCSCPSRSVCRHLIAAILFLRDHGEEETAPDAERVPEEPAHRTYTQRNLIFSEVKWQRCHPLEFPFQ